MKLVLTIEVPEGFDTQTIKADLVNEAAEAPKPEEINAEPTLETPTETPEVAPETTTEPTPTI